MKKILLASAFALFGTFAMANEVNCNNLNVTSESNLGGTCWITIRDERGNYIDSTVVWAESQEDCEKKGKEFLRKVEAEQFANQIGL